MECATVIGKIEDNFKNLIFNQENHTYMVNGIYYPSVSSLIKNFHKPFEIELVAGYSAPFRGVSAEELIQEWEEIRVNACKLGHGVHNFGEYYAGKRYDLPRNSTEVFLAKDIAEDLPQKKALIKFWNDKPEFYVPVSLELRMYCIQWGYAGTIDIILLDTRDNTLVITDYKTNKDLYKQYSNQKLLSIFSHLDDTPFSKYEIQLSLYQILLEQTGYKVSRRFVVWLKDDGEYYIINTTDYTERLKEFLHKKKIDESW